MCPMRWERGGVFEEQREPTGWQQKAQGQRPEPHVHPPALRSHTAWRELALGLGPWEVLHTHTAPPSLSRIQRQTLCCPCCLDEEAKAQRS